MKFNYNGHSNKSGTYVLINSKNGHFYIGSCKRFKKRWSEHVSLLRTNKHKNPYLQNAFNKYGSDAFVFETLSVTPVVSLLSQEQELLDGLFDNQERCYNISRTAYSVMTGRHHSNETRKKMRLAHIGKPRGAMSEEHKKKLSESHKGKTTWIKGKKHSQETKDKISAHCKGCSGRKPGYKVSAETRKKMSESHKRNRK